MKFNKKASGTASSFLIASLIGVTILVAIGLGVNNFSSLYSQNNIDYFDNFGNVKNNISSVSEQYVESYDIDENGTKIRDVDRTEDLLFAKSFNIVKDTPKVLKSTVIGVTQVGSDLGIPPIFTGLIVGILGIIVIAVVIKIIRGFTEV